MKFIHCPTCIEENEMNPTDIGVSDEGALSLTCTKHKKLFFHAANEAIGEILLDVAMQECSNCGDCGCDHGGGH